MVWVWCVRKTKMGAVGSHALNLGKEVSFLDQTCLGFHWEKNAR